MILVTPPHGPAYVGILYSAVAGNDHCNGRVAQMRGSDYYPNLKEALHWDDAKALLDGNTPIA